MNLISAILRIICGFTLMILSYSTYQRNSAQIGNGEPMTVFGYTTSASAGQLTLAFCVIGLIGIFLVVRGVVGLLHKRE